MKMNQSPIDFSESDLRLIAQAAEVGKYEQRQRFAWIGAAMVIIGAAIMVAGNPSDNKTWGFAIILVGAFTTVVAYTRFRLRALRLIHKLQLTIDPRQEGAK